MEDVMRTMTDEERALLKKVMDTDRNSPEFIDLCASEPVLALLKDKAVADDVDGAIYLAYWGLS
jgi:hypothetical protein